MRCQRGRHRREEGSCCRVATRWRRCAARPRGTEGGRASRTQNGAPDAFAVVGQGKRACGRTLASTGRSRRVGVGIVGVGRRGGRARPARMGVPLGRRYVVGATDGSRSWDEVGAGCGRAQSRRSRPARVQEGRVAAHGWVGWVHADGVRGPLGGGPGARARADGWASRGRTARSWVVAARRGCRQGAGMGAGLCSAKRAAWRRTGERAGRRGHGPWPGAEWGKGVRPRVGLA